jgi:hypothetical protein
MNRSPQLGVTVQAIRYLLTRVIFGAARAPWLIFQWIEWRLRHNLLARQAHYRRNTQPQL